MGFGNPAAERAALEQTYEDRTDVLRPGRDREGNLTRTVYELVYGALPCALSRAGVQSRLSRERSGQNRAESRLDYDAVLFLAPEPELRPGDRVRVQRADGETLELELVGRAVRYPTAPKGLLSTFTFAPGKGSPLSSTT